MLSHIRSAREPSRSIHFMLMCPPVVDGLTTSVALKTASSKRNTRHVVGRRKGEMMGSEAQPIPRKPIVCTQHRCPRKAVKTMLCELQDCISFRKVAIIVQTTRVIILLFPSLVSLCQKKGRKENKKRRGRGTSSRPGRIKVASKDSLLPLPRHAQCLSLNAERCIH